MQSLLGAAFPDLPVDDTMKLARGAPGGLEGWTSLISAAIDALRELEEGSVALNDGTVTVTGHAASSEARARALQRLGERTDGLVSLGDEIKVTPAARSDTEVVKDPSAGQTEEAGDAGSGLETSDPSVDPSVSDDTIPLPLQKVRHVAQFAPAVSPYVWEATRTARSVVLEGHVPDEDTRSELVEDAKRTFPEHDVVDKQRYAKGAPQSFRQSADVGLDQLRRLEIGAVRLSEESLEISGRAPSKEVGEDIRTETSKALPAGVKQEAGRIVFPESPLPEVDVANVLAKDDRVADDVCQVLLNFVADEERIHFDVDSADLAEASIKTLDKLISIANRCPVAQIEIAGHTDDDGTEDYNARLSARRANVVADYLTRNGIDAKRLRPVGYGEVRPLVPNSTSTNKSLNRRIEFNVDLGLSG